MGLSYTDGSRFSIQYPFPPIIMDMIKMGVSPRVATFRILRQVSTWRNSNGCLAQHLCVP